MEYHKIEYSEVLKELNSSLSGLSNNEAKNRLKILQSLTTKISFIIKIYRKL